MLFGVIFDEEKIQIQPTWGVVAKIANQRQKGCLQLDLILTASNFVD